MCVVVCVGGWDEVGEWGEGNRRTYREVLLKDTRSMWTRWVMSDLGAITL